MVNYILSILKFDVLKSLAFYIYNFPQDFRVGESLIVVFNQCPNRKCYIVSIVKVEIWYPGLKHANIPF